MITREWPGTETGWDCGSDEWLMFSSLNSGYWSQNERRRGCITVRSTSAVPLSKFYSYKIWAKREGEPFNRAERPTKNLEKLDCSAGYKACGTGNTDTQSCVKDGHSCPINDIIISDTNGYIPEGYKPVPLDSGKVRYCFELIVPFW